MQCKKCNAQIDDDSKFCKSCGVPTADAKPIFSKKQIKLLMLLSGIAIVSFICGLIMCLQYSDLVAMAGMILIGFALILLGVAGMLVYYKALSTFFRARAEKEAMNDKLLQDIQKKLDDLNRSKTQ